MNWLPTASLMEYRARTKISKEEMDGKFGKILTHDDYNVLITRACRILTPEGQPLAVYLPGAVPPEVREAVYPTLHELKKFQSDNRGPASGYIRAPSAGNREDGSGRTRTRTKPVASAIIGAIDPAGPKNYCRLTQWTGEEADKFSELRPLFKIIADLFEAYVPGRFAIQNEVVKRTQPEWVIPSTPFTTVTVNNTYPTGVHKDAGDLPEGFSNVTVIRKGRYSGGYLTFPEYRIAVDLKDGDSLLMDAHEWHGNVKMELESDDAERISVVCYYRTKMAECSTQAEEFRKATVFADKGTERGSRLA